MLPRLSFQSSHVVQLRGNVRCPRRRNRAKKIIGKPYARKRFCTDGKEDGEAGLHKRRGP